MVKYKLREKWFLESEESIGLLKREDMLELTRRMNMSRSFFNRIAGSYRDVDGWDDGSFNIHFLKLSAEEKEKMIKIAKAIPFAETNLNLKSYRFPGQGSSSAQFRQLLLGLISCGLKNDALMDTLYEHIADHYHSDKPYAIYMFHGRYDIPVKAKDNEWLEGSEEVYDFLICAICPLKAQYEPDEPSWGFLYPSFADRSSDQAHIAIFNADAEHPNMELREEFLGI